MHPFKQERRRTQHIVLSKMIEEVPSTSNFFFDTSKNRKHSNESFTQKLLTKELEANYLVSLELLVTEIKAPQ